MNHCAVSSLFIARKIANITGHVTMQHVVCTDPNCRSRTSRSFTRGFGQWKYKLNEVINHVTSVLWWIYSHSPPVQDSCCLFSFLLYIAGILVRTLFIFIAHRHIYRSYNWGIPAKFTGRGHCSNKSRKVTRERYVMQPFYSTHLDLMSFSKLQLDAH